MTQAILHLIDGNDHRVYVFAGSDVMIESDYHHRGATVFTVSSADGFNVYTGSETQAPMIGASIIAALNEELENTRKHAAVAQLSEYWRGHKAGRTELISELLEDIDTDAKEGGNDY